MKNKTKLILLVVLLIIITSSISVYATQLYMAKDISYTKSDGTQTNVESALDELYSNVGNGKIEYQAIASSSYKTTSAAAVFDTLKVTIPAGKKKVYIYSAMSSNYGNNKPVVSSDIIVSESSQTLHGGLLKGVNVTEGFINIIETNGEAGEITINYSSTGKGSHFAQAIVFYE